MILTFDEAKNVNGRFREFKYICTVTRTEQSKDFGCFMGNDLKTFELECYVYFYDESHFIDWLWNLNLKCNGLLSMYSYKHTPYCLKDKFSATQVLERIYERTNYKYTVNLITSGSIDYIM